MITKKSIYMALLISAGAMVIASFVLCSKTAEVYYGSTGILHLIFALVSGLLVSVLLAVIKKKTIEEIALPIYVIGIAIQILCLILMAIPTLLGDDFYYSFARRALMVSFGDNVVRFPVLAGVPLFCISIPSLYERYDTLTSKRSWGLIGLTLLPVVFSIPLDPQMAIILSFAAGVTIFSCANKKRQVVKRSILLFVLLGILAIALVYIFAISEYSDFYRMRLSSIFLRGQDDPYGHGWMRIAMDRTFGSSSFLGDPQVFQNHEVYSLCYSGNTFSLVLLARFGWSAFLLLLAIMIFFLLLLVMMWKLRNEYFSSSAIFSASILCCQAIMHLLGIFF